MALALSAAGGDAVELKLTDVSRRKGKVLGKGGPVGDGHGRPDDDEFRIEKAEFEKGEFIRFVIHPNKWWGQDLTRIDQFRIERD